MAKMSIFFITVKGRNIASNPYCKWTRIDPRLLAQLNRYESFDFSGHKFRKRIVKAERGNFFYSFKPTVSKSASHRQKEELNTEIRGEHD